MNNTEMNHTEAVESKGEKRSRGLWGMFVNFLAMGGFLVILIGVVAVIILISYLTR